LPQTVTGAATGAFTVESPPLGDAAAGTVQPA
jgi:hypothetical protein